MEECKRKALFLISGVRSGEGQGRQMPPPPGGAKKFKETRKRGGKIKVKEEKIEKNNGKRRKFDEIYRTFNKFQYFSLNFH